MKNVNEVKGLASLIKTEFMKEHFEVDRDQGLIEWEHDRILVTLKTYERFLILGKDASSAWMLYCFYFYKARKDGTNQPWATDNYCYNEKGLNWSKDKFTKIKKLLIENGFIETIKRRNGKGRITGHYVRVVGIPRARIYNYHNPENQGNGNIHNPDFTTSGKNPPVVKPVTSTLIKTNKVLKENNKQIVRFSFCDLFKKTYNLELPNDIIEKYDKVGIEKCVNYQITIDGIKDPKKYLRKLLIEWVKDHAVIPDIKPAVEKLTEKNELTEAEKRFKELSDQTYQCQDQPEKTKEIHGEIKKLRLEAEPQIKELKAAAGIHGRDKRDREGNQN